MKNILIVGAGYSGSVIGRILAEHGLKITIIDKRNHIGGNAFDYTDDLGIRVHKYGPHLFHTSNQKVVDFLSQFTEWTPYLHKVKALLKDGRFATLPVNAESANMVGKENVIDIFVRPYSEKMWGMKLEDISTDIINRVPIREDLNELYFPNDHFQNLPTHGYTKMFENILNHPKISISLNTQFEKNMEKDFDYIFNSMPIDEYYEYLYGELPYRSLKFHIQQIPMPKILPVCQVNFTHEGKFTRVSEWKNLPNHGTNNFNTTVTFEEPCDYKDNNHERFYPVKDSNGKNREIYNKYAQLEHPKMTFIGRLGLYAYLDMDQCVNSALKTAEQFLTKHKIPKNS